ncbi:MAG TPA: lactonase family protein [Caulobacteraceae bacterium]|nr:lactonase family protein [Caulobacteraceae bacterium]
MRPGAVVLLRAALAVATIPAFTSAPALAQPPGAKATQVYIGTLGKEGIFGARLDPETGQLSTPAPLVDIERPSWLALDPNRPILYSVSETGNEGEAQGGVYSLGIDPATGGLKVISRVASGGGGATYLSYDARLQTVFVANYGGGQVAAVPVNTDGSLQPASSIQTDTGRGPNPKQNMAHAHGATADPSGHFVLTPDMGADRVFVRRYDAASKTLSPGDPPFVDTGPATGPRHLVFSPDGRFVFVLTELSAEVRSFRWDRQAGRLKQIQALPIDRPDFTGVRSAAEIVISKDGRYLYVSNRAEDTLLVFAVNRKRGTFVQKQVIACGGHIPRSLGIDPSGRWLLVANENSKTLTEFKIGKADGELTPSGAPIAFDTPPVSFAFYPG